MSFDDASNRTGAAGWARKLNAYRTPDTWRASVELAITALPFALIWSVMAWAITRHHLWVYALLLLPAVGFLVRLFLIQHDCGHQAFFASRRANDWAGRCIGLLTLTAYDHWRHAHAIHHATSGNLDRRGVGDIDTITVAEYLARSRLTRLRYRVYRHPAILFGIGPSFIFMLQNRLPAGFMRIGWRPWISTMATNLGVGLLAALLIHLVGVATFLLVAVPILVLSATVGAWLFYVQHQFVQTRWDRAGSWDVREASLHGSSHYDLPAVLRWFTANIGVHHVHHLSSGIPYYRLQGVLRDHPSLRDVSRVTLRQSIGLFRLALWDEDSRRMISFAELRRRASGAAELPRAA